MQIICMDQNFRSIRIVLLYIVTIYSYYYSTVILYIYAYAKHFIIIGYYFNLNIAFLSNLVFLIFFSICN